VAPGRPAGLTVSHPFRDPRLVTFALGLPAEVRATPGMNKPLLQKAMVGVPPEAVRTKSGSPGFDDVYGLGLSRNLPNLERMVRASALVETGILDPDRVMSAVRQEALGIGDAHATDRIDKTLALSAWFDHRRATPKPADPIPVPLPPSAG
jgi:asparagine synthase (glutamine-hydrolysing)